MNKKTRVPLFHIAKRSTLPWYHAWAIRGGALILALLVCAGVTAILTGENAFLLYVTMVKGSFGSVRKIWVLLQNIAMLLCVSLAVTPAFRMRCWNLGGEGQVLVGGLASVLVMTFLSPYLPNGLLILVMLLASILVGAVWAGIPAIFKAQWNTNETLFTLMMNYVAMQLVAFYIAYRFPKGTGTMGVVNGDTRAGWLPYLLGQQYLLNILIVALLTGLVYAYLRYSKHGYEIAVVGESERTARYVGINVKRVIIRTMLLSGAICGLAGFLLVSGTDHSLSTTSAGGRGFTAVMVSWLAKFNPIWMIFTSFLLVFLGKGASEIASQFRLNESFGDILTGIILFFIIGSEFFIQYKILLTRSAEKEEKDHV